MKKFFLTLSAIAMMAPVFAQEAEEAVEESASFHHVLKGQFIDGGPAFMAFVALAPASQCGIFKDATCH